MLKKLTHTIVRIFPALIFCFILGVAGADLAEAKMYAGSANPGVVYESENGDTWTSISPTLGKVVLSLVEYNGHLYAGTMSSNNTGQIYRHDSGTTWTLLKTIDYQVASLVVWRGKLYAGTVSGTRGLYRYEEATGAWTLVLSSLGTGVRAMEVWEKDDALYLGDWNSDRIWRYNGTTNQTVLSAGRSCIWDFEPYKDKLFSSAYYGMMYSTSNGTSWPSLYVGGSNIWAVKTFNDKLFFGDVLKLRSYDGSTAITEATVTSDHYSNQILSLAKNGSNLYVAVGGEAGYVRSSTGVGKIYRYDGTSLVAVSGKLGTAVQILYVSPNDPPVADAGPDQTVECAGPQGASVNLDGSGSSDVNNDVLTYTWKEGDTILGTGETLAVVLPLGEHEITLTVDDNKGGTAQDTVTASIRDTTPPTTTLRSIAGIPGDNGWYRSDVLITVDSADACTGVKEIRTVVDTATASTAGDSATIAVRGDGVHSVSFKAADNAGNVEEPGTTLTIKIDNTAPAGNISVTPGILWPPNHKMVNVAVNGGPSDGTSGIGSVVFTVTDEYGTVEPVISGFNTTIPLEAWRDGTDKDGRHYTIMAVITDNAGNTTAVSTEAICPHDMRDKQ